MVSANPPIIVRRRPVCDPKTATAIVKLLASSTAVLSVPSAIAITCSAADFVYCCTASSEVRRSAVKGIKPGFYLNARPARS
jgi:hypothetical protein